MANFKTMKDDMTLLSMSGLVNADIGSLLNKCQREEIEEYPWSFLFTNVVITGTIPYTTGTVTLTQGSATVTSSGATFTSNMVNWFLFSGPTLTTPQLATFATSSTLTLSTAWQLPTTTTTYSFQPLYYDVFPLREVYEIRQIDILLMQSQADFNLKDPSRIATGGQPSLEWAPAPFKSVGFTPSVTDTGHYQIELWPRTTMALPYIVNGKLGPIDMVNDTDIPMLPSTVLEAKAMMYLCRSTFANNGNPKWLQLAQEYKNDYMAELDKAKTEDLGRIVPRGQPIVRGFADVRGFDAAVDYNHDFIGPPYRGA